MHATPILSRRRDLLIRRLHRRKTRERERLFIAGGVRCAREALAAKAPVRFALTSPRLTTTTLGSQVTALLDRHEIERLEIDDAALARLAATESPQGILLVCEQRQVSLASLESAAPERVLLLDALQDPGNLGALVRTAAAFTVDCVIALDGCVDPWNPKAVRATAGTLFRMPIVTARWQDTHPWLERLGLPLLVAAPDGEDPALVEYAQWGLAVGNEGAGVRAQIVATATATLTVPITAPVESLNAAVAGAIVMYALSRQH